MAEKFTVEEFKNYLLTQDSRGDIMYNLSAENIKKANISDADGSEEKSPSKCIHFHDLGYCGSGKVDAPLCLGICSEYEEESQPMKI